MSGFGGEGVGPPSRPRMTTFKFLLSHPEFKPNPGTAEVTAPNFEAAIKFIATQIPGVHVVALVSERPECTEEVTA